MDGCFLHIFFSSQYFTIIFSVLVLFSAMTTIYWNPINRAYVTRSNFEYFFSTFYSKVSDKIMDKIKKLKYEKNNDKMNIKFKNSGMFAVVVDDSVAVKNSNISFTKWKISNEFIREKVAKNGTYFFVNDIFRIKCTIYTLHCHIDMWYRVHQPHQNARLMIQHIHFVHFHGDLVIYFFVNQSKTSLIIF